MQDNYFSTSVTFKSIDDREAMQSLMWNIRARTNQNNGDIVLKALELYKADVAGGKSDIVNVGGSLTGISIIVLNVLLSGCR